MKTTIEKLSPDRLRTSGKMTALLGYVCEQRWTDPAIIDLVETSDGFVLAGNEDDPMCNDFFADRGDVDRNIAGVAVAAELTEEETAWLVKQVESRIRRA